MAMTKKEQAHVEALLTASALRATSPVEPDVEPPGYQRSAKDPDLTVGFLFAGEQSSMARVEPSCSSSVHHGFGQTDKVTTQGSRRLYSTRLLALRALRYATEQHCANLLRKVDRMIEDEQGDVLL